VITNFLAKISRDADPVINETPYLFYLFEILPFHGRKYKKTPTNEYPKKSCNILSYVFAGEVVKQGFQRKEGGGMNIHFLKD
jgi:hypothetical protein